MAMYSDYSSLDAAALAEKLRYRVGDRAMVSSTPSTVIQYRFNLTKEMIFIFIIFHPAMR